MIDCKKISEWIIEGFEKGLEDGASKPIVIGIDLAIKEKLLSPPSIQTEEIDPK